MGLDKVPYVNYTLDEDREEASSETINIRINEFERERLDRLKWFLHENKDGTALKYALEIAENVLHGILSEDSLRKICSQTRRKQEISRPKSLEKK
jgi:hypothetical protein